MDDHVKQRSLVFGLERVQTLYTIGFEIYMFLYEPVTDELFWLLLTYAILKLNHKPIAEVQCD